jgi:hypothetical protein
MFYQKNMALKMEAANGKIEHVKRKSRKMTI